MVGARLLLGTTSLAKPKPPPNSNQGWIACAFTSARVSERYLDTVEVWRSSRHGPTIFFNDLQPLFHHLPRSSDRAQQERAAGFLGNPLDHGREVAYRPSGAPLKVPVNLPLLRLSV